MTNSPTPSIHHNVVPSEVGWQFVPQYYTFVNKQPDRLHCFYTKTSTFIHGTEGEDGKPCYGQQVCLSDYLSMVHFHLEAFGAVHSKNGAEKVALRHVTEPNWHNVFIAWSTRTTKICDLILGAALCAPLRSILAYSAKCCLFSVSFYISFYEVSTHEIDRKFTIR